MCVSFSLCVPASANEIKQIGLICNNEEAMSAAAFFRFVGEGNEDASEVASLVSSPAAWCVPGYARNTRPMRQVEELGEIRNFMLEDRIEFASASHSISSMMSAASAFTISPLGFVFSAVSTLIDTISIADFPVPDVELHTFTRENGKPGFVVFLRHSQDKQWHANALKAKREADEQLLSRVRHEIDLSR